MFARLAVGQDLTCRVMEPTFDVGLMVTVEALREEL